MSCLRDEVPEASKAGIMSDEEAFVSADVL